MAGCRTNFAKQFDRARNQPDNPHTYPVQSPPNFNANDIEEVSPVPVSDPRDGRRR